jgi:hypothetical protein
MHLRHQLLGRVTLVLVTRTPLVLAKEELRLRLQLLVRDTRTSTLKQKDALLN